VATQVGQHGDVIRQEGFELIPMRWNRGSLNPLHAVLELHQIVGIYRKYKPDLVHHVALKPSLLGSMGAVFARRPSVVNNLAGLGQAFSSKGFPANLIRTVLVSAFRVLFSRKQMSTIVENSDDLAFLTGCVGLRRGSVALIRGIGVDEKRFLPTDEPAQAQPVVTMVSRMLWPKGVQELVDAALLLKERGIQIRVRLVGVPDPTSRVSVPEPQLRKWSDDGVVEWLGHRDDIPQVWRESNIAILPSWYREGIPRSLLEAASCGRAIITTDMPGCREIVVHGFNGLLVPPRDARAIADAITQLVFDPSMRQRMGAMGRQLVEKEFSERYAVAQTVAVYRKLVGIP
jgi:glycosyltransferase involved in cell wall biosynthesis